MATCAEGKPFRNSNDHSSLSGSSSPATDENDHFSAMLSDSYVSPSEEFTHGFQYYADSPETFGMDESSRSPCSNEKDVMMSSVTSESIQISMTETPKQQSSKHREKHYETMDSATLCFTDDDQDDNHIAPLYITHNSPKNYPITGERTPLPDINSFIRDSKPYVGIESTNCTRTRILENSPSCLSVKTEPDVFNSAGEASPNSDEFRKDGAWLFPQNSNCRSNPCLLTYTTLTGRKPHSLSDSSICCSSKKSENGMNDYFTTIGQDSVLSSSFPRTSASKNTESACLSPELIRDNYNFNESYKIFKHPISTDPIPAEHDRGDHLCSLEELKLNYFIPDEYYTEEELEKAIERTDIIQIKHLTPSQTEFFPNSPVFENTKDNHFSTNGAVFNMSPVGEYTCKQELFPDREEKTLCTLDSYRGEYRVSDTPHHVKPIILPKTEPNEGLILANEIENGDLNRTETSIAVRDDQYKSHEFVENCLPASPNETSLIFTYDDNRSTYLDLENMDDMKTLILKEVAKDVDAACSTLSLSPEPTCWTEDEVQKWITWIVNRNKLPPLNASLFQVDGCQLCTMTESEMRSLAPRSGDILHAHLEIWRTVVEARSKDLSKDLVFAPTSKHTHQPKLSSKHRNEHYKTTRPIKKPKLEIGSGFSVYPSPVGSPTEHVTSPNFGFTHADISSQRHENGFRQIKKEMNCGTTGLSEAVPRDENPITIMTPNHTAGIHLWQFLKELLLQPLSYGQYIRWIDQERGIFKIEDSVEVARLWGIRKNRPAMNYDKLSRSIRQYYKKGIIKKTEVSQRLVYQFVKPIV